MEKGCFGRCASSGSKGRGSRSGRPANSTEMTVWPSYEGSTSSVKREVLGGSPGAFGFCACAAAPGNRQGAVTAVIPARRIVRNKRRQVLCGCAPETGAPSFLGESVPNASPNPEMMTKLLTGDADHGVR